MAMTQPIRNRKNELVDAACYARLIVESAADLLALFDAQNRLVYMNPACERLFDDPATLIGSDTLHNVHPDDRGRVAAALSAARQQGSSSYTFRFLIPGHDYRYFESRITTVNQPESGEIMLMVTSRDVTNQRASDDMLLTRELQLLEAQELSNLGFWDSDLERNSITWSSGMRRILGVDEGMECTVENYMALIHPDDRQHSFAILASGIDTVPGFRGAYRIVRPDGNVRMLATLNSVIYDEAGRPQRLVGVCQDITDWKGSEERARVSEERFRLIADTAREYAFYQLDVNGHVASWNSSAEHIKGYSESEILGKHYSIFFPPEQTRRGDPEKNLAHALQHGMYEGEGWRMRKSGARFWAHVTLTPLFDEKGELRGFSKVTHDITDRQRVEEDLRSYAERLRVTSARLAETQETERRMLAGELHDRVGPNLTALGLNLSLIANNIAQEEQPELMARLEESSLLVRRTVDVIRDVMGELRPHVLDDYGLLAALRPLATAFHKRTGIAVGVNGEESSVHLPKLVVIAMFRIAQEALNNVAKHSQAKRVEIAFTEANGRITLSIGDDGVGLDPKRSEMSGLERGWGLMIMRERAEAVGARFALNTTPGNGVQITVEYRI